MCIRDRLKVILHSPNKWIREAFKKCRTLGNDDTFEGFVHLRKAHYMFGWDSVSYTHLDVYKRQALYRARTHTKDTITLGEEFKLLEMYLKIMELRFGDNFFYQDVYKRQLYRRPQKRITGKSLL